MTDTSDSITDTGSLLYAVNEANANTNTAGSLILFGLPTSPPSTITLDRTLVLSEKAGPELITGPGASYLTISGNTAVGVFQVDSNANATIGGLTITKGQAETNGGGIDNLGTLTLDSCSITNNTALGLFTTAESFAGGQGGGIDNQGTLTISGGTIASNTAGALRGRDRQRWDPVDPRRHDREQSRQRPHRRFRRHGLLRRRPGRRHLQPDSAHDHRQYHREQLGFQRRCRPRNAGMATMTDCTIVGNTTIWDVGGGLNNTGTVLVTNCTIADNSAFYDGGGVSNSGTATMNNTIVALNTLFPSGTANDTGATTSKVTSASANNLIGTGGSGGLSNGVNGNQVGVANPGLGPLANNGGPTQTMALLAGSPAIEHGSSRSTPPRPPTSAAPETRGSTASASSTSARTSISSPFPHTFTCPLPE